MARKLSAEVLRKSELAQGWVAWHCPDHGFLAAGPPDVVVICGHMDGVKRCTKRAQAFRNDGRVSSQELSRLRGRKKPHKTPAK